MIAIGCDHGGFKLKEEIKKYLDEKEIEYIDCGCMNEERVDYPNIAKEVALSVQQGKAENNPDGRRRTGSSRVGSRPPGKGNPPRLPENTVPLQGGQPLFRRPFLPPDVQPHRPAHPQHVGAGWRTHPV